MSSDEEEENQLNAKEVAEILRISNQKKREFQSKFLVSGWEDDLEGVEEENNPHGR